MTDDWDGTERRAGPDPEDLQREIRATRQDLGRLAAAVTTLGADEKLQAAVDSVAREQQRHWQRLMATVVAGLAIVAAVAGFGVAQATRSQNTAEAARDAAEAAGRVSAYVDHCLVHPSEATPGECGNTAATGEQSAPVLALFCYLRVAPESRTEANAADCFRAATEQARKTSAATTTTTTTRG